MSEHGTRTVREALLAALPPDGGLLNPHWECCCSIDDLAPCGAVQPFCILGTYTESPDVTCQECPCDSHVVPLRAPHPVHMGAPSGRQTASEIRGALVDMSAVGAATDHLRKVLSMSGRGDERVYVGTPADVAREADADAHPWSEPGVVPADAVAVYGWAPELVSVPYEAVVQRGMVTSLAPAHPSMAIDNPAMRRARFRKRPMLWAGPEEVK